MPRVMARGVQGDPRSNTADKLRFGFLPLDADGCGRRPPRISLLIVEWNQHHDWREARGSVLVFFWATDVLQSMFQPTSGRRSTGGLGPMAAFVCEYRVGDRPT